MPETPDQIAIDVRHVTKIFGFGPDKVFALKDVTVPPNLGLSPEILNQYQRIVNMIYPPS